MLDLFKLLLLLTIDAECSELTIKTSELPNAVFTVDFFRRASHPVSGVLIVDFQHIFHSCHCYLRMFLLFDFSSIYPYIFFYCLRFLFFHLRLT